MAAVEKAAQELLITNPHPSLAEAAARALNWADDGIFPENLDSIQLEKLGQMVISELTQQRNQLS